MRHDPIAYTYDADVHCPHCTFTAFGSSADGWLGDAPEVGAIAPWDEWEDPDLDGPQILACGDCGCEIATTGEDEG